MRISFRIIYDVLKGQYYAMIYGMNENFEKLGMVYCLEDSGQYSLKHVDLFEWVGLAEGYCFDAYDILTLLDRLNNVSYDDGMLACVEDWQQAVLRRELDKSTGIILEGGLCDFS